MSHNPEKEIVCPNCGHHAKYNYCEQCGQNTHLHKETFWGLVTHFVADYFHYDSKFWVTLKTLWFKPGALTVAYWNKQRMRYIPPVSLYIFVSAVFFLVTFSRPITRTSKNDSLHGFSVAIDSLDEALNRNDEPIIKNGKPVKDTTFEYQKKKIEKKHGDYTGYVLQKFKSTFPKLFFVMIPIVAFMLKLLFWRRKTAFFVDHAIFSIHLHTLFFSLYLIPILLPKGLIKNWVDPIALLLYIVYFIIAMKRAYHIGTFRAIMSSMLIMTGYMFFFIIAILLFFILPLIYQSV